MLNLGPDDGSLQVAPDVDSWTRDSLCQEYPPSWWFPARGESSSAAKEVCARCSVREECLSLALGEQIGEGIWGGLAPAERRQLRRDRVRKTIRSR